MKRHLLLRSRKAMSTVARTVWRGLVRIPWRRLRPRTRRSASIAGVALLTLVWFSSDGEVEASVNTWNRRALLDAIRFVESGNRENVPDGDDGKAIGPYQIHQVYWFDATEFDSSLGGTYQQCRKRNYAERVIDAYMRRYVKAQWAAGDGETVAKVHNGGPKGHQKKATKGYWQRVKKRLPAPR
ncbi:MAG: hypothetical protein ACI89X_002799 [Planctomycetota bacterium]|jgi:hypothetical protein